MPTRTGNVTFQSPNAYATKSWSTPGFVSMLVVGRPMSWCSIYPKTWLEGPGYGISYVLVSSPWLLWWVFKRRVTYNTNMAVFSTQNYNLPYYCPSQAMYHICQLHGLASNTSQYTPKVGSTWKKVPTICVASNIYYYGKTYHYSYGNFTLDSGEYSPWSIDFSLHHKW